MMSQENLTGIVQPAVALNFKVAPHYSHYWEISQQSLVFGTDLKLRAKELDFQHFSKFTLNYHQSISLGVRYRLLNVFENAGQNELRITQQYNLTDQQGNLRFGHRFRLEQRIISSLIIYRFRYRFAFDTPLNGEALDVGEAYVILSTESLISSARTRVPEYDQRFTVNFGWLTTEKTKLQAGIGYRLIDFTQNTRHAIYILSSFIISL